MIIFHKITFSYFGVDSSGFKAIARCRNKLKREDHFPEIKKFCFISVSLDFYYLPPSKQNDIKNRMIASC